MRIIISILLLTLSNSAYATFSPAGKITELYSSGGWVMIKVDNVTKVNPANCASSAYYGLNLNNDGDKNILSMLLAAEMAQKNVSFWIHGCEGQGNKYPGIGTIKIFR